MQAVTRIMCPICLCFVFILSVNFRNLLLGDLFHKVLTTRSMIGQLIEKSWSKYMVGCYSTGLMSFMHLYCTGNVILHIYMYYCKADQGYE